MESIHDLEAEMDYANRIRQAINRAKGRMEYWLDFAKRYKHNPDFRGKALDSYFWWKRERQELLFLLERYEGGLGD